MLIVGIDPSLSSTGVAEITGDPASPVISTWRVRTSKPKAVSDWQRSAQMRDTDRRIEAIRNTLDDRIGDATLVFVEEPIIFGSATAAMDLNGLARVIGSMLHRRGIEYRYINSSTLKAWANVKPERGKSPKPKMVAEANRRWGLSLPVSRNDEADAVLLADLAFESWRNDAIPQ